MYFFFIFKNEWEDYSFNSVQTNIVSWKKCFWFSSEFSLVVSFVKIMY